MTEPMNGRWEPEDADAVSAAWDALAGGSRQTERDGPLVDTARRLHALDTAPALTAAQRARIWQEVLGHAVNGNGVSAPTVNGKHSANGHAPGAILFPRTAAPVSVRPESRARWLLAQLATAALVLLTVGIAYVAFAPRSPRGDAVAVLPAILAPDVVGSIGDVPETLLDVTVPAAMVPTGDSVRSCLSHITVPPHVIAVWDAVSAVCCPGTRINYVLSGTYLVRPADPIQVIRAGGNAETWDGGSEVTLGAGDAVLIRSETPFEAENPAAVPVELLQQILSSPATFPRGTATLAGELEHDYDMRDLSLRGEPMQMRLQRTILAPGAVLTSPSDVLQMWITYPTYIEGRPVQNFLTVRNDGSHGNITEKTITVYTLDLKPVGFGSLTP